LHTDFAAAMEAVAAADAGHLRRLGFAAGRTD